MGYSHDGYKAVAYFVNWAIYARNHNPWDIPAEKLTHVLYSFADNQPDGTVILTDSWSDVEKHNPGDSWNDTGNNIYGCLKQFFLLKKRNRNLKVLLSIGGWTYAHESKHFDAPASTAAGRQKFADSCVQLIKDVGFDGIDVDWEYPSSPAQGEQFVQLLQAIRSAMDAYAATLPSNPKFDLTIAAPAGKQNYQYLPLQEIANVVDFINLMAYDYSGSWDSCAGHQANIYHDPSGCTPFSSSAAVSDYIAGGVPASKLVLGMPLYGRAFTNTDGPGKNFSGVGDGSWENGIWDYKVLPKPGAQEFEDDNFGASWSYDPTARTMVSYDTVGMAVKKAAWIKDQGLGGAMWWETSGDRNDTGSIIQNVVLALGGQDGSKLAKQNNNLEYPDSKYDNIRTGCQGQ
ncbi:glycoside hydrolase [Mytilinidion resinicola]|uniref:chitinase n=1 Tax=Mytilinidion resinicola TaxID=574789 RepID=A0A6A6YXQ8_9PEZI|nr:glycoside hydrolase [Mytilinidion resinicola]KAF2813702.1 glycoside hydrolase [Mytilinidion resinicola]